MCVCARVCWRSLRLICVCEKVAPCQGPRDERMWILQAVQECSGKIDRERWWLRWWSLVCRMCEACCWNEDADIKEKKREWRPKENNSYGFRNHLIFKIFNLFVCLFVLCLMFELQTSFIDTASNWGRLLQKQSTLKAYLPCLTNGYGKGVIFFFFLFFSFGAGFPSWHKIMACSVHYSVKHWQPTATYMKRPKQGS